MGKLTNKSGQIRYCGLAYFPSDEMVSINRALDFIFISSLFSSSFEKFKWKVGSVPRVKSDPIGWADLKPALYVGILSSGRTRYEYSIGSFLMKVGVPSTRWKKFGFSFFLSTKKSASESEWTRFG